MDFSFLKNICIRFVHASRAPTVSRSMLGTIVISYIDFVLMPKWHVYLTRYYSRFVHKLRISTKTPTTTKVEVVLARASTRPPFTITCTKMDLRPSSTLPTNTRPIDDHGITSRRVDVDEPRTYRCAAVKSLPRRKTATCSSPRRR